MSAPRVIAELVVTGLRVLGKATAAAGAQAVRNFKHKPEGAPSAGPVGAGGSSKSQITNQMNMTVEEAQLILNVKKEDPMEVIQKSYDRIFAANSPPPETTPSSSASAGPSTSAMRVPPPSAKSSASAKRSRAPLHSHYLQSKVYRALERIKAERLAAGEGGEGGAGAAGSAEGAAAGSAGATGAEAGAGTGAGGAGSATGQSAPPP